VRVRALSSNPTEPPPAAIAVAAAVAAGSASLRTGAVAPLLPFPPRAATRATTNPEGAIRTADLDAWEDTALIRHVREVPGEASVALDALFRRHHRRVAAWCLRWCRGRDHDAADLAQEVFLRAQEKLAGFRFESSFTTWLYLVTRTVALNRADAARRRPAESLEEHEIDPIDPALPADEVAARDQQVARLRAAIAAALDPAEAKVLRLHYHDGLTLPEIDLRLGLTNKSGAKAFLVAAKRKLQRHFATHATAGVQPVEEDA
jgi:RNA polymerase sigma-70 factor (ECF subfamily)